MVLVGPAGDVLSSYVEKLDYFLFQCNVSAVRGFVWWIPFRRHCSCLQEDGCSVLVGWDIVSVTEIS